MRNSAQKSGNSYSHQQLQTIDSQRKAIKSDHKKIFDSKVRKTDQHTL